MMLSRNYSTEEINHFNQLASQWWDQQGAMKMLHAINPLRLEYIVQHSGPLLGKRILDIGCGGGILSESLAREGAIVTGIDQSSAMVKVARAHAATHHLPIDYQQQSAEEHAVILSHRYEIITCMELLEHLPDPAAMVQTCSQLLVPQGYLFLATLNRNLKSWLLAIIAAEYLLGFVPKGTHTYKKFIRPSELCHWLEKNFLRPHHIIGLTYHPFWGSFQWSSKVDVNYLLVAQSTKVPVISFP